jgi:hypothetical protein
VVRAGHTGLSVHSAIAIFTGLYIALSCTSIGHGVGVVVGLLSGPFGWMTLFKLMLPVIPVGLEH